MTIHEQIIKGLDQYKNIALVLPGGGAKGAFQAGAIECLYQLHPRINIKVISGVSVGALNGSMIATDQVDELLQIWRTIEQKDVYRKRPISALILHFMMWKIGIRKPLESIYDNKPLYKMIKATLDNDISTDFIAGVVDLSSYDYKARLFEKGTVKDTERFHKTVLASTAIPGIWPPVYIDNVPHVDGGLRNITPVGDVLNYTDPDLVIIIPTQLYPTPDSKSRPGKLDIIDTLGATLTTLLDEIYMNDIDMFMRYNKLAKQVDGVEYYEPMIIAPQRWLGSALDFSRKNISRSMIHGYTSMEETLRHKFVL